MMEWFAAALFLLSFVASTRLLKLVQKSRAAISLAHRSIRTIRCLSLSVEAKELALQRNAKELLRAFFALAFGGTVAILPAFGLLWLCDKIGFLSLASVLDVLRSPVFLVASGAIGALLLYTGSVTCSKKNRYSGLDRTLHRLAFRTYGLQASIAELEDQIFAKPLATCPIHRPVFITALPRTGTTVLLECCASLPEFASHCYRDMPFVLIPCLWSSFSARFRQSSALLERAHGDGVLINVNSPEALEEVLWKTFWQPHYQSDRIIPWESEEAPEFDAFFQNHMRKILMLRRGNEAPFARYVSKNNLNIARIQMLHRLFPDAIIIIPFRRPLDHAASLLEQHRNFLRIHQEDRFALEYMEAIGHYDFGENLRPIDFGGWLKARDSRDTDCIAFWLEYWVNTYRYLLMDNAVSAHFFNYDTLCKDPEGGLQTVATAMEIRDLRAISKAATRVRSPRQRKIALQGVPVSLMREADAVYASLTELALH